MLLALEAKKKRVHPMSRLEMPQLGFLNLHISHFLTAAVRHLKVLTRQHPDAIKMVNYFLKKGKQKDLLCERQFCGVFCGFGGWVNL